MPVRSPASSAALPMGIDGTLTSIRGNVTCIVCVRRHDGYSRDNGILRFHDFARLETHNSSNEYTFIEFGFRSSNCGVYTPPCEYMHDVCVLQRERFP